MLYLLINVSTIILLFYFTIIIVKRSLRKSSQIQNPWILYYSVNIISFMFGWSNTIIYQEMDWVFVWVLIWFMLWCLCFYALNSLAQFSEIKGMLLYWLELNHLLKCSSLFIDNFTMWNSWLILDVCLHPSVSEIGRFCNSM